MGILDNKACVITGSGRGLGAAYARLFAQEGAMVVVNDVDGAEAEKVAKEITAKGGKAVASADSVYPYESASKIIQKCVDSFGKIDVLVNNAGIVRDKTVWNMTVEEFDAVINVHLKGSFYCGQHAIRLMRAARKGTVINIVSGAHQGNFGQTNYSAAKGGIASMTYTWAVELAKYGVRVNAVAPSGLTRMTEGAGATSAPPPDWSAPLIAYLASDETNWVHGQVFNSSGEFVRIMEQPKYALGIFFPGGPTINGIRNTFKRVFYGKLEPYGLAKQPYPHYGGLKAEPEKPK